MHFLLLILCISFCSLSYASDDTCPSKASQQNTVLIMKLPKDVTDRNKKLPLGYSYDLSKVQSRLACLSESPLSYLDIWKIKGKAGIPCYVLLDVNEDSKKTVLAINMQRAMEVLPQFSADEQKKHLIAALFIIHPPRPNNIKPIATFLASWDWGNANKFKPFAKIDEQLLSTTYPENSSLTLIHNYHTLWNKYRTGKRQDDTMAAKIFDLAMNEAKINDIPLAQHGFGQHLIAHTFRQKRMYDTAQLWYQMAIDSGVIASVRDLYSLLLIKNPQDYTDSDRHHAVEAVRALTKDLFKDEDKVKSDELYALATKRKRRDIQLQLNGRPLKLQRLKSDTSDNESEEETEADTRGQED